MATLKISDLSVGDWVRCRDRIGRIERLEAIRSDERVRVAVESYLGTMYLFVGIEDIEPIPITAKILEKNGFVKKNYDNGKMWDWWWDNVLVRKYADEDIYRFIVALNSKHYTTTMVVGKHTHQLQHALRLAGVDKEINL